MLSVRVNKLDAVAQADVFNRGWGPDDLVPTRACQQAQKAVRVMHACDDAVMMGVVPGSSATAEAATSAELANAVCEPASAATDMVEPPS